MAQVKLYREEQLEYRMNIGSAWEDGNHLFTQWNGRQMYPSTPYGMFKKIIRWHNESVTKEEYKLPEIPLHGLRHTSATLLISQNVDIRTVSGRLGHAQTSTTTDIYSHFLQKADEAASNTLENLFHIKVK
jgi:integrase